MTATAAKAIERADRLLIRADAVEIMRGTATASDSDKNTISSTTKASARKTFLM